MSDDIENYTTERTIAFFAIGDEHYVAKDLSRAIAADLESKVKRIAELDKDVNGLMTLLAKEKAENERLREQLDEQNDIIRDLDNALAGVDDE